MSGSRGVAAALVLLVSFGCTPSDTRSAPEPAQEASQRPSPSAPSASSSAPDPSPAPSPSQTSATRPPRPVNPVSLPALMRKEYDGRGLRLREVLVEAEQYTEHYVTYRSGSLTISGVMHVPRGKGPFPTLVLAHGYINPDVYVNGQGLSREQVRLAQAGFVTLHTDYRGHASSEDGRRTQLNLRLGYTEDVINAVLALRRARLGFIDKQRIGLLGRSMGGGVVYNTLVVRPGLVDAAVAYAPVSSDTVDNFNRWTRQDEVGARIIRTHGSPHQDPRFWRQVSPRTYFERVTEPLLIHHGTADESCPIRWSRQTVRALRRTGNDVRMYTYPGEPHAFIADWTLSMRRSVRFLDRHLGVGR